MLGRNVKWVFGKVVQRQTKCNLHFPSQSERDLHIQMKLRKTQMKGAKAIHLSNPSPSRKKRRRGKKGKKKTKRTTRRKSLKSLTMLLVMKHATPPKKGNTSKTKNITLGPIFLCFYKCMFCQVCTFILVSFTKCYFICLL